MCEILYNARYPLSAIRPIFCLCPVLGPLALSAAVHLSLVTELETIRKGLHVRVLALEELIAARYDTHWPGHDARRARGLGAQPKVAGVLLVDAEGVAGAIRVGIHVGGEPFLCGFVC